MFLFCQSMVLYRWKEGRLMQRWIGHKREITKVGNQLSDSLEILGACCGRAVKSTGLKLWCF